jgi:phosphomannomutase
LSIYRPCDIRGHAEDELQPELYRRWGLALGAELEPLSKFVVGGDVRASTPRFLAALVEGLCQAGMEVVDLGILPTPMIYYARRRLRAAACAIVTASHNPGEINGLKWSIGGRSPGEEEFALLQRAAEAPEEETPDKPGTLRTLDISFDYVGWLQQNWVCDDPVDLRIVVDPMHGCCGRRARRYLQAVFPMAPVSAIRDKAASDFGGTPPDCSNDDYLEALSLSVEHERADLGIAFDGDGDRAAFVDDTGTILTAEEATSILLASFGSELDGETFVYDLKFSDQVPQTARELGAAAVVERSGHTFVRNRMLQTSALFGAEISGHYFFHALGGSDDGLFAACRMIDYVARSGQSLSQLRRACPTVFVTPELRVPVNPRNQQAVIDHVQAHWLQYPHTLIDGVRVDFPKGWALARRSVTEAAMTFRFEASDWSDLDKLVWDFSDGLPHVGDALWARYEEATGKHCHPG